MSVDMEEYEQLEQQRDYTKRTPREQAYQAIDTERAYQDTHYEHDHMTIELCEDLISKYWKKLVQTNDQQESLHRIRQIAALCVSCMEQYAPVPREPVVLTTE